MNSSIIAIMFSINMDNMDINIYISEDIININMEVSTDKVPYISYPMLQEPEIFRIKSSINTIMIRIKRAIIDFSMEIN